LALTFCLVVSSWRESWAREASAELKLGISAYNDGDYSKAVALLKAAAEHGEAEAMVDLGYMYARGHGVRRDAGFALELYRRAAKAGDAEGMNAVGYRLNFSSPPDYTGAAHWYCMAVLRGNSRAMNNLANLFYHGRGVPLNKDEARSLWRQGMERGDLNAQVNLGEDLASDTSLSLEDRRQGIDWLVDAARRGSGDAQAILRKLGDTDHYPRGYDKGLDMRLEPLMPKAGHSSACDELLIS
jgi:TPR repeat protein